MFDVGDIIALLKKTFSRKDVIFIVLILSLYFASRLIRLTEFPIFGDEGIYIRWAKVAWHDASWRFISLTDGKQPLQTWATIPFLKLFPDDALLAGRLFAVFSGFVALVGIFALLLYLFDKKTAYIGSLLYVVTPYFLFYDRMALVDSAVNASAVWILFFSILLAETIRLDVALLFGLVTGLSLLAKSSVRIFLALSSLSYVALKYSFRRSFVIKLINFFILFSISALLALAIYNIQRFSPFFHYVAEKNKTFVMTFSDFLKTPLEVFPHNVRYLPLYLSWEMGFVATVLGIIGLILLWRKDKRLALYLWLWLILPYIIISFFTRILFPRYLIFLGSLLLIGAAFFFSRLKKKNLAVGAAILLFFVNGYFDFAILFDYKNIPFPDVDRGQYIEGTPAGWGVESIIEFVRQQSQQKPVILLAEGNFGVVGDMLDVFLRKNDRIAIKGYWPLDLPQLEENQTSVGEQFVYIVFSHREKFPQEWPIRLVKKFEKPANRSAFYLFELLPNK